MMSSPNQAVLAEIQEPPLNIRRQYLAEKQIIKYRTFNTSMIRKIAFINTCNLTTPYWRIKNSPPLADGFVNTNHYEIFILNSPKYPIFQYSYQSIIFRPTIIYPEYSEIPNLNNLILTTTLNAFGKDVTKIFTDGSKSEVGIGAAFFVSHINHVEKFKLADIFSIYSAESLAIKKSLLWCTLNPVQTVCIMSDSKSVLQAIEGPPINIYNQELICEIKNLLYQLNQQNKKIILIWVKGHSGIIGNERVDYEAKEACKSDKFVKIFSHTDLSTKLKKSIKDRWTESYNNFSKTSKNLYFQLYPQLPNKIPHTTFDYIKRHTSVITRLKLNHGRFRRTFIN